MSIQISFHVEKIPCMKELLRLEADTSLQETLSCCMSARPAFILVKSVPQDCFLIPFRSCLNALKTSFLYWDFSTKWVSWKAPPSVPYLAITCVSFSKPCLERLEKPSKFIHTSRNNGIDFILLTKTTMFFMCSNSSGWRKAVNSSRVAAKSPSRSAVLKRLSSLGSIFLKLCWSVASWNSSGFSANESRWSQKCSPLKHTSKTKLFKSRNKKVYCQNSCCSKWKFSSPRGFKFRGQVLGLIFKDDNSRGKFLSKPSVTIQNNGFCTIVYYPSQIFFICLYKHHLVFGVDFIHRSFLL